MLVDQICQLEQMLGALLRRGLPPGGERGIRRQHRAIDLLRAGLRHLRDHFAGRRVIHRLGRALAIHQLAVNQQLALHRVILLSEVG